MLSSGKPVSATRLETSRTRTLPLETPRWLFLSAARRIGMLLLALLLVGFWVQFILSILNSQGLFYYIGVDWGMFWAAARAALGSGPASVYDLRVLGQYVQPLGRYYGPAALFLKVNPVPYPPMFVSLLIPFTLIPPSIGFLIWTALNAAAVFGVVRSIVKQSGQRLGLAPLLTFCSLPVGVGLLVGQPIGLFLLAFYEGYRLLTQEKDVRAGLWLGVLLLKPQLVAPLIMVLVLKRRWYAVAGVCGTGLVLGMTSLFVLGVSGVRVMLSSITGYASGVEATKYRMVPQQMISWRGLLTSMFPDHSERVYWIAIIVLSLLSLALLAWLWRGSWSVDGPRFSRRMLATTIITMLVGFDMHIHSAVLLIVPMLVLAVDRHSQWASELYLWIGLCGTVLLVIPYSLLSGYPTDISIAHVFSAFMFIVLVVVCLSEYRHRLTPPEPKAQALWTGPGQSPANG